MHSYCPCIFLNEHLFFIPLSAFETLPPYSTSALFKHSEQKYKQHPWGAGIAILAGIISDFLSRRLSKF